MNFINAQYITSQFPWAKVADETYATLTKRQLLDMYVHYWHVLDSVEDHDGEPLTRWLPNRDCDNKAGWFRMFSQAYYSIHFVSPLSKSEEKDMPQGVAVGEVWYQTRQGGGHAINVAFLDQGANKPPREVFIEPQTDPHGQGATIFVDLTTDERKSLKQYDFMRF